MALRCEDGRRREFTTPFGCRQGWLLQTTRLYIKCALDLDVSIQIGLHSRWVGELRIEIDAGLEILGDQFRVLHRGADASPEVGLAIVGRPLWYDCKSDDKPLVFISPQRLVHRRCIFQETQALRGRDADRPHLAGVGEAAELGVESLCDVDVSACQGIDAGPAALKRYA